VIEVFRAAAELQKVCAAEGWRFCFIGGLAVIRWGEPRETVDADLTLLTFPPDVPLRTCSAEDLTVQAGSIDWDYVRSQLAPLVELKEAPEILERLEQCRVRSESGE
jgi:hypothetical protein